VAVRVEEPHGGGGATRSLSHGDGGTAAVAGAGAETGGLEAWSRRRSPLYASSRAPYQRLNGFGPGRRGLVRTGFQWAKHDEFAAGQA
jgi:hypothetical protein